MRPLIWQLKRPMRGHQPKQITFNSKDLGVDRIAEVRGVLGHRVQYRLEIGRRARDDAQDLGGRRLLLQRLGTDSWRYRR
jgi:hypothetical protein